MNIFRHIQSLLANPYEPENMRALIEASWRVLLGAAAIFIVGILICGGFVLMYVLEDVTVPKSAPSSAASSAPAIRSDRIDAVLGGFAKRQAQFDMLKASSTPALDPAQ